MRFSTIAGCRSRTPACNSINTERAVRTASSEQVRQPIYRDATEEWRAYEPHLEPLKAALGPVLDAYPERRGLAATLPQQIVGSRSATD